MNYKNFYKITAIFLATFILFYSLVTITTKSRSVINSQNSYTIVIDAGHGGIDKGTYGKTTHIAESDINLSIAYHLKDYLERFNYNVIMTRTDDNGLYGDISKGFKARDLEKRKQIATDSHADFVISIHCNSSPSASAKGVVAVYNNNDTMSTKLAMSIMQSLNSLDNVTRTQTSTEEKFLSHKIGIPSLIIECGFLSNPTDEKNLADSNYQKLLAQKIGQGIIAVNP